jgi:PP-loop superfamily ATP-utilizing enzyme
MELNSELQVKFEALRASLSSLESLLVAYSGGTDSAFLAYAAHTVLGDRMLAANWLQLWRSHRSRIFPFTFCRPAN